MVVEKIAASRGAQSSALVVTLLSAALGLACVSCAAEVGEGEPLAESREAIDISSLSGLRSMSLTGTYRLTRNITMQPWDAAFVPIGSPFNPFRGTFDGNGYTITNLRITGGSWYSGLFSATNNAVLDRVRLVNVNVQGGGLTGGIVGIMSNTTLKRSYVTGTVSGPTSGEPVFAVGMAIGQAANGSRVDRCYATGTVRGRTSTIGGFFGEISTQGFFDANHNGPPAYVTEVFTNVNVTPTILSGTGEITAGGLAGYVQGAEIQDVNTVGNVNGRGAVGGVIGRMTNDEPESMPNILNHAISRGSVTASGSTPAGPIGVMTGSSPRCIAFYNLATDSGTPSPTGDIGCNAGKGSLELTVSYQNPADPGNPNTRDLGIFILGDYVEQWEVDNGDYLPCLLGSGSDSDWGFGTCGNPQIWAANTNHEHITLVRIPNPSVQPK
jgi:hypothetical protein